MIAEEFAAGYIGIKTRSTHIRSPRTDGHFLDFIDSVVTFAIFESFDEGLGHNVDIEPLNLAHFVAHIVDLGCKQK